jgi:hypothetical protein
MVQVVEVVEVEAAVEAAVEVEVEAEAEAVHQRKQFHQ